MKTQKVHYWLECWSLTPDGELFETYSSLLLPVITQNGIKAMLKITHDKNEQMGNALMAWWEGKGAAKVIAHKGEAILLERAVGTQPLLAMSVEGQDEEACRIICSTANYLHSSSKQPFPQLSSLHDWFYDLKLAAQKHGGIFTRSYEISEELFLSEHDIVVLHGDLHHGNILDFGKHSGWLAIDPKGLIGERGFDFANIFINPDLANPALHIATHSEIFEQRFNFIAKIANLDKERFLMWIIAWCGLSAAWSLESKQPISTQLKIAELALLKLTGQTNWL